ncbi:hypothetical protein X474_20100 [Dethiosulfatarculus sandiegensis]|uniref:Uncharacterized protein n=1 Tax=Dethiosulfatarculus sandiegensis TaxID=1429043 RepID=A0A0D2J9A1_9BACT|nr:hypothetical protein X474_20100 [Dethiosulfatarculus sandiegensis]
MILTDRLKGHSRAWGVIPAQRNRLPGQMIRAGGLTEFSLFT